MNAVKCLHCGTVIESTHRNDFKGCNCADDQKRVYVDGGKFYKKRCFGPESRYEEVTEARKD